MVQTNLMRADEIANGFNTVAEREYWRANIAGGRVNPEINFNSRASMVCVTYRIATEDFTVSFSKTSAAFGDFLASAYRSMAQVLAGLKAAGLPFEVPLDATAALRIEYDPRSKRLLAHVACTGDDWPEAETLPFKVPQRNNVENSLSPIDGL